MVYTENIVVPNFPMDRDSLSALNKIGYILGCRNQGSNIGGSFSGFWEYGERIFRDASRKGQSSANHDSRVPGLVVKRWKLRGGKEVRDNISEHVPSRGFTGIFYSDGYFGLDSGYQCDSRNSHLNPSALLKSKRIFAGFARPGSFFSQPFGLGCLILSLNREFVCVSTPAPHLAQLPAHNAPLKYAYDYQAECQKYDASRQADHQPFRPLYPVINSLYCILHLFIGYAFCWWGGWVIWRRWRIDALTFRTVLYGFLFYVLAGSVLWHGFIVLQKVLTARLFPYDNNYMANVLSADKQIAIIGSLAEGSSIRSIERVTGVHRDTIMRLGVHVGKGCTALMDARMRNLDCQRLELDEIWGFVGKKERHIRPGDDPQVGNAWTFCAIDADTKLVPAFKVGSDRDVKTTTAFVLDVAERMKNRVQISTDGLAAYVDAMDWAFSSSVDYGQIIKTYGTEESVEAQRRYSAPKIKTGEKKAVVGRPNFDLISTSYVERLNGTTRLHMKRLARLTYAFSKKRENFEAAVGLHFAYYNFVRRHSTIRCTPAMAAGVSSSFWTVGDLLEASA